MRTLVANFSSEHSAEAARRALIDAGVDNSRIVSAPAWIPAEPEAKESEEPIEVSADPAVSPGAESSGALTFRGAALGSVIGAAVGVVTTPVLGPIGIAAGLGVGAYAGSLVGALSGLEPAEAGIHEKAVPTPENTRATLTIAVQDEDRQRAQEIVRTFGAAV